VNIIGAIFRQYWSQIAAIVVFILAALRYWRLGNHLNDLHITWICSATAGLLFILIGQETWWEPLPDSMRLTKDPNWMRRRSYAYRSKTGPILGAVLLIVATIALYRL